MDFTSNSWISIVMTLVVAFGVSFIATPVVKTFAKQVGAIDVPDEKRTARFVSVCCCVFPDGRKIQVRGECEGRILTECAIFADKIAVDEETVRLRSHIAQMRGMFAEGSPIGRKMDFLIQEFNREANTIGSKCQSSDIAHVVVDLKSEIEKIREQIQNIE